MLRKIDQSIRPQLSADESLYTDLRGLRAQENPTSTVPPDLMVTTARPDMVYVNNDTVVLIELTIPFNSPDSLHNAQARKQNKQLYQQLLSDLDSSGKQVILVTIEIGSLGHSLLECHKSLVRILPSLFDNACSLVVCTLVVLGPVVFISLIAYTCLYFLSALVIKTSWFTPPLNTYWPLSYNLMPHPVAALSDHTYWLHALIRPNSHNFRPYISYTLLNFAQNKEMYG